VSPCIVATRWFCRGWRRRLAPGLAPAFAILYLVSAPIVGAPLDEEDYRNTVLSSLLHAQALMEGRYAMWTSALAFGVPLPLHPALLLHPLAPILGIVKPEEFVRIFYAFHAGLGAVGCWWLVRHLGVGAALAGVAAATWALSTPALQYAVTDFWLSYFLGWSLFPFLVVLALRVLEAPDARLPWPDAIGLGCVAGIMLANGHAGQTSVLFAAMAVMVLAEVRRALRALPALALAAAIAAVIAAPSVVPLLQELQRFPDLPRLPADSDLGWRALTDALLRPFLSMQPSEWFSTIDERGTRVPFFGGPLLLAALAVVFGCARPLPHATALVATFLVSGVVMALPASWGFDAMAGTLTFRDPAVLFGIVLGSLALQCWAIQWPTMIAAAGTLQVIVLFLSAWPFVSMAWRNGPRIERAFLHHSSTTAALRDWVPRLPGRWYLAPQVDEMVRRGFLEDDGLAPDVWVYRGLPIVNGTFKGISLDTIYPSGTTPIGRIRGEAATVANAPTLSVLGIGAVLAMQNEPIASALEEVARFDTRQGPIRLLRNPQAWRGAAFVDAPALAAPPPALTGCIHSGVLCRDFTAVAAAGPGAPVRVTGAEGRIGLRFGAHPVARWMLVSEMYRPAWTASGDGKVLRVEPAWDALLAVEVPPGVSYVELQFRPPWVLASIWAAVATLLSAAAALAWFARDRARLPGNPSQAMLKAATRAGVRKRRLGGQ